LVTEKVRIPARKKGVPPSVIPRCARPEIVQRYEDDQIGGPDKVDILIAWDQPLTSASQWNTDAITLLAEKAQQSLRASSEIKYDRPWLELPELRRQIVGCLKETKAIMKESTSPSKAAAIATRARRRTRKHSVSYLNLEVWKIAHFRYRKLVNDTQ
jgi:hypothetical protein